MSHGGTFLAPWGDPDCSLPLADIMEAPYSSMCLHPFVNQVRGPPRPPLWTLDAPADWFLSPPWHVYHLARQIGYCPYHAMFTIWPDRFATVPTMPCLSFGLTAWLLTRPCHVFHLA